MYPKIGIRPAIDGRWGGVREGLEEKTMAMASAAAQLIGTLRYPDGTFVECVISPTTIGGGAEAAQCEAYFATHNVVATLTVTPCWCYGSETFDMNPATIKAVWGFNGTQRPGAVYLAAVMSAYAQKGLPAFSIYGRDVQDLEDNTVPDDVRNKILDFAKCAIAVGWMRNKSYVNMGSVSMGIAGSYCNEAFFQKYLNIRAEWVDLTEILRRMKLEIYDAEECQTARAWIATHCREGIDVNEGKAVPDIITRSKVVPADEDWDFIAKMTVIIKDILHGNPKLSALGWHEESLGKNAVAGGFQGQRHWTDWLPNGDFTEAILASTFDWTGAREPMTFATENDTLNGVSMLFGKLVSDTAPCFHDVRTYWSPQAVAKAMEPDVPHTNTPRQSEKNPPNLPEKARGGFIHLINSGATALDGTGASKDANGHGTMKPFWEMTQADITACLDATRWCRANNEYFRGGGYSSQFKCQAEMPVTLLRVNIIEGVGPVLQIAEGHTVVLDDAIHAKLDNRTDPTWPTTWFVPNLTAGNPAFADVYNVMANWGSNHGVTVHGHVGDRLITLASMLRIPVSMHNIEAVRIFRPHAWAAFGTESPEAADYRACATYGPLYK
ncbi:MAG: L-fucose isomerase [Defluviitaleaceae bacterium]|nr:L-fucose isomerase [Defluviitaleaceae bacterium]